VPISNREISLSPWWFPRKFLLSPLVTLLVAPHFVVLYRIWKILIDHITKYIASMSNKISTPTAQSDAAFFKQTELAREALKNFTAISALNAPGPVKTAFEELVTATVGFNNFVRHYLSHPSFQEIPPRVFSTLETFLKKHPNFELPKSYDQLGGLNLRVRDSIRFSVKKGACFIFK
jgi:hypothetical protein